MSSPKEAFRQFELIGVAYFGPCPLRMHHRSSADVPFKAGTLKDIIAYDA